MGVGLVRSLQHPDILWVHWRVYNFIANTSKGGTLSAPFWCLCQKLSLSPLYFNKTLFCKALSHHASLALDWIPFLQRPRIPVSLRGSATTFHYHTIGLISHSSKVMLKILQARLQQCMNRELPDVQAGFKKGRGTRDQIANIRWIIEKAESYRKVSTTALLTMPKPLTVWITTNCGTFLKRWEYQATLNASGETCRQSRSIS